MMTKLMGPAARACRGVASKRSLAKRTKCLSALVPQCLLLLLTTTATAGEAVPILDKSSFARCFTMGATPRIKRDSGEVEPYVTQKELTKAVKVDFRSTPPPPEKWREVDFDDGAWVRVRGFAGTGASLGSLPAALICARSRFEVRDPASAGELSLTLAFIGGAAVHLNGQEVGRGFLPAGELKPETPAEVYPAEAYVDPDGFLLRRGWADPQKYPDRFRNRVRTLGVKLPAKLLRKGTNVLAVEVHGALTSELMFKAKVRQHERFWANWGMCALEAFKVEGLEMGCGLTLSAPAGSSAVANTGRPAGFQVWNQPVVQQAYASDYGDPSEPLRPIDIRGARGGVFSGQVVAGSPSAVSGLKAAASELRCEGGPSAGSGQGASIPASAVEIRFAQPDSPFTGGGFDSLHPEAPAEVPVDKAAGGAVQPIWIGVRVPRDARPGAYAGKVTVSAAGSAPVEVPIRLKVADWEVPDPKSFATHVGLIQSPDSVALRYGVPMWSEEHWKLLEKSFELLGQVGNDTVYIPLLRRTHFGNEHGMVRWIRKEGAGAAGRGAGGNDGPGADDKAGPASSPSPLGPFTYDFSIAERYLDLAVKHLGKPPVVSIYCWEVYTGGTWAFGGKGDGKGKGLGFTVLDPKTGALEEAVGPEWGTPEVREFLKPVLEGLREILKKRGLESSMMVGLGGDTRPSKACVEDLKALLPEAKWEVHTHPLIKELHGVPLGYLACVWGAPRIPDPGEKRQYGWKNAFLWTSFPREGVGGPGPLNETANPVRYMITPEGMLVSGGRGIGRVGADFWPALKDGHGRFRGTTVGRYRDTGGGGSLSIHCSDASFLAPGKSGAVSTVRFEMLRAGAQECEARIAIEKVLTDPALKARLDPNLAGRCQELLDERLEAMRIGGFNGWPWFVASGWQERNERLFEAAGEVARAVK